MKATNGTRRSLRAPLLLAAFLGLATSASGCIIDGDSCDPTIFIPWSLETSGGAPVTCGAAGVYSIGADVNGYPYDVGCAANQSFGTMSIPAAGAGNYNIVVRALDFNGLDVVPPTPPINQAIPTACGTVMTPEAVFVIP